MTAWQLGRPCQFVFSKSTKRSTNPPRCVLVRIVDGYAKFAKMVMQSLQGYAKFAKLVMQSLQGYAEFAKLVMQSLQRELQVDVEI